MSDACPFEDRGKFRTAHDPGACAKRFELLARCHQGAEWTRGASKTDATPPPTIRFDSRIAKPQVTRGDNLRWVHREGRSAPGEKTMIVRNGLTQNHTPNNRIVTGSYDNTAKLWSLAGAKS